MQNRNGLTLKELIVVVILIPIVVLVLLAVFANLRIGSSGSTRLVCGTNLKGLGTSMFVYAFDYNDKFPVAGGGTHTWGSTTSGWDDPQKKFSESKGTVTVAASMYLLVREADVGYKSFVCPESDQTAFENKIDHDAVLLSDFGPDPTKHLSYSYQFPYGKFAASGSSAPENAILADRNPWFDDNLTKSSIENETSNSFANMVALIDPQSQNKWKQQIGNSRPHDREGQNVLYADSHVSFEKRPDVGYGNDNIYTMAEVFQPEIKKPAPKPKGRWPHRVGGTPSHDREGQNVFFDDSNVIFEKEPNADLQYNSVDTKTDTVQANRRKGIAPLSDKIDSADEHDSLLISDRRKKKR